MRERELKKLCEKWQQILRLRDWKISVRVVDDEELDEGGECRVFQNGKMALIRIKSKDSYSPTSGWIKAFPEHYDLEITLVHELLHIPFDSLIDTEDNEHASNMEEQALEFLAQALVKLDRGER